MNLLPRQIQKEEFQYYSDQSVEDLKADIQKLFIKSKNSNFSINLTGEFISTNEFTMTPKWQYTRIKNYEREISYLSGRIFPGEQNRTRVSFTVRPNSIFALFFFLFPVGGLIAIAIAYSTKNINNGLIHGLIFTFVVPSVILVFGYFSKKAIKERFISAFKLKPFG